MPVGYTEVESRKFIVYAPSHSGHLSLYPVTPESRRPDHIPVVPSEISEHIFQGFSSIALAEHFDSHTVGTPHNLHDLQRLSSGLSTLRALGEHLSGAEIPPDRYDWVNHHYVWLAKELAKRGLLPRP